MLSHFVDYLGAHPVYALLAAFLVSFGEAMLILGLFVPSTAVLLGLGALIGLGKATFLPVFLATVAGAIAGDALSFWAGVHWKERIRGFWPFCRYVTLMDKGEQFIARHGGKSIFIVRFIPGVKAVVPTIARMMGMSTVRFAVVNVVSAFAWAAVHLLPAMALGRGLQVAHTANPRFAILSGVVIAAAVAAWVGMRLARDVVIPFADRGRLRLATALEFRGRRGDRLARMLRNHDRTLEAAVLMAIGLGAFTGFTVLLAGLIFDPELALADAAISQAVQGLRTDWATSLMVAVTMLGDTSILMPIALLLVAALAYARDWRLAGAVATACVAGTAFVPLFKTLVHRARPVDMYQGADGFSFPSGHSTLATIILGALALIVAQAVPLRFRGRLYATVAALIALIAFSRVYLLAHWPSDVLAGLFFGGSLVAGLALFLHGRTPTAPRKLIAAALAVVGLMVVPIHVVSGWQTASGRYEVTRPVTMIPVAEWRATGWQRLPTHRVLLDGDPGEPILAQTTLPLADVVTRLQSSGWQATSIGLTDEVLWSVLPSRQDLSGRPSWPMTHLGRPAQATLTKAGPHETRLVLRLWATDVLVSDSQGDAPLLLVSITADQLDPIAFGFSQLEDTGLPADLLGSAKAALAVSLGFDGQAVLPEMPLLIPR